MPGKFHGRRNPVGCSPWGRDQLDTTERLHFHELEKVMATHSLCSCLENPRDGEAWWAAVYGVAQSWTRLKQLSSSSSSSLVLGFPGGASGKEPACQCRRHKRCGFDPWVGKIPWRRAWQPTPVFLSGESPRIEEPGGLLSARLFCPWNSLGKNTGVGRHSLL